MGKYILKRVLQMIPVILCVSLLVFGLLQLMPGDPARISLGSGATEAEMELYRVKMGLNQPPLVQYGNYMKGFLSGNLGVSYNARKPVSEMIMYRLGNTLTISLGALLVTLIISLFLGTLMALKANTFTDNFFRVFTLIFSAMPGFWLGLLMILFFSVHLRLLPPSGTDTPASFIMPIACTALFHLATLTRAQRSSMLDVMNKDYIRTAKAKGLDWNYIIRHHMLKNSLLPYVTLFGKKLGNCFAGTLVVETVFGVVGLGVMTKVAMDGKDMPVIMSSIMISAIIVSVMNLVTDLVYGFLDPRIMSMYKKSSGKKAALEKPTASTAASAAELDRARKNLKEREKRRVEKLAAIKADGTAAEASKMKKNSMWKDIWKRLKRNKAAIAGAILFILILILCFGSRIYYTYSMDIVGVNAKERLAGPSLSHLFGTDELGRDLMARVLWGGCTSIICGLAALALAFVGGTFLGTISGYYGGILDTIIMRAVDVIMAIPTIMFMLVIASILTPSAPNLCIAIGLGLMAGEVRLIRGQVLQIKGQEFIEAAKIQGASDAHIIFNQVLPNALGAVITPILMDMCVAINLISTLSFIGMGIQPPNPEWGTLLATGKTYMRDSWNLMVFPGLALLLTVVALTLMADGLRDALDPKMKR